MPTEPSKSLQQACAHLCLDRAVQVHPLVSYSAQIYVRFKKNPATLQEYHGLSCEVLQQSQGLGRPLGYSIFSLLAIIGDPIY